MFSRELLKQGQVNINVFRKWNEHVHESCLLVELPSDEHDDKDDDGNV